MIDWVVGIDPGATGGVAVLTYGDGHLEYVEPLPTYGSETDGTELAALLLAVGPSERVYVGIEQPFANNRASSISQLNQGTGFGVILGVVQALGFRHERLRPLDWKRELGMPMGKGLTAADKKRASRQRASQMWPDRAGDWRKTTQDGLAEAALIGEATRRRLVGG